MPEYHPDDIRLLLDENISPAIAPRLWDHGIDAVPVRDRAMLRVGDHRIFKFAVKEERAVVTIDESDFSKLASRFTSHPGVVVMPSGGSRDEQFDFTMAVCDWARKQGKPMVLFRDNIASVDEEMNVTTRVVRYQSRETVVIAAALKPSA